MSIIVDEEALVFQLDAKDVSYLLRIHKYGVPIHLYHGKRLKCACPEKIFEDYMKPYTPCYREGDPDFSLETAPQEYPLYGVTDYRPEALQLTLADGVSSFELQYKSHKVFAGKPVIKGLPATFCNDEEAQTLAVLLQSPDNEQVWVELFYTVFEKYNVITRSAKISNVGNAPFTIHGAASMAIDFPGNGYDTINLGGAYGKERWPDRMTLHTGERRVSSTTGASSHVESPFLMLCDHDATETAGNVYGFNLVYSGNHECVAHVGAAGDTRVLLGINPANFSWLLEPGEDFYTPEAVLVYSDQGIGQMSRTFHDFYRQHLSRSLHAQKVRPVLINNWEATYFDFDHDKIVSIAKKAAEVGVELFVLDDGWFGKRNFDNCSLGDWYVNETKLPGGLRVLANKINDMGMDFGIWVEPEMVSPDSDLYREHPDWCLHTGTGKRYQSRDQLVLDLSRTEVQDYIINAMATVFSSASVAYVKWDMNRPMTNVGSKALAPERQKEVAHRYMLGLYRVMDVLTDRFPDILFEGCAGGGGRFDAGMLHYMPQFWASDDTDAWERCKIQYGTSYVFPPICSGNHVSAVPNHQTQRITPLHTRGNVALSGAFGFELDLTALSKEELTEIKRQVCLYKKIRGLVLDGDFYRIHNPFTENICGWQIVSKDKTEVVAILTQKLFIPNSRNTYFKFQGLDPKGLYQEIETGNNYYGDELMYMGIQNIKLMKDFDSCIFHLRMLPIES